MVGLANINRAMISKRMTPVITIIRKLEIFPVQSLMLSITLSTISILNYSNAKEGGTIPPSLLKALIYVSQLFEELLHFPYPFGVRR